MKIALIGPAYPYRGGIAHHTNMLTRYLRLLGHTVDVITFRRQYPKVLYPGADQMEAGGPDKYTAGVGAVRLIDSVNPFNWLRVGMLLRRGGYDLIIFKYWLPFFAPAFGTIARIFHRRGRPDVMVIFDNLFPHEKRPGDRFLTRYLCRYCFLAITQSGEVSKQLAEHFPHIPQRMHPHPTYDNFGQTIPQQQARSRLNLASDHVLLFFGFIRPYKGLERLLEAMPEIIRRIPDAHLLVVGEVFGSPAPFLQQIQSLGIESHVTMVNRYVPNDEVALWFSAADMVVLPYVNATNSGIVQIAYNFAVPAIVTDVGSLREVVLDGKTGFVLKSPDPDSIAGAVQAMYTPGTLEQFRQAIAGQRQKYTWDAFAKGLESFALEQAAGTGGRGTGVGE